MRTFDALSFWLGFLGGILTLWLLSRLRPALRRLRESMQEQSQKARVEKMSGDEVRIGNNTMRLAQGWHLAAPLFSLNEILVPPRVLAPMPAPEAYERPVGEDVTDWCIPYLPDWPELASHYNAPAFSLAEALQGGANLIVIGQPGSGKTVALAYLATQVIRGDPQIGKLSGFVPFLVHAADLVLPPRDPENLLASILDVVSGYIHSVPAARLPRVVQALFTQGRALLLLDGLDELPPPQAEEISQYLKTLLRKYPELRVVAAANPEALDGLLSAGLIPVALASWGEAQRKAFISQWSNLWYRFVVPATKGEVRTTDPALLIGWLTVNTAHLTPLELALKVWAAFAGDALGPTSVDAIEAYLKRMMHNQPGKNRQGFEQLASQMALAMQPVIDRKNAERWLAGKDFSLAPEEPTPSESETAEGTSKPVRARGALPDLLDSGLVVGHLAERITIAHPAVSGYLASLALSSGRGADPLVRQPEWAGKTTTLHYLAIWDRQATWINDLLKDDDSDPLLRGLLGAGRWLRDVPENTPWVSVVLRKLAGYLHSENKPLGLRGRILTALALSGNSGAPTLLRQLLVSPQPLLRQLAALGCGLLRDTKAIQELTKLIDDRTPGVSRAALLALVAIGDKSGLETVAYTLLQGDEGLRRSAAEALANHPEEGHPTLEEGSTLDDTAVRRAAAFGLGRIRQPWATAILEKMHTEDPQWVVQDAATQMLDTIHQPHPRLPIPLPALTHTPWLIAFAGEQGMGVAPGKPAYDLLYLALKQGNEAQRLAATYYLSQNVDASAVLPLYQTYFSSTGELRETAYSALWNLAAAGISLPPPVQYGLK